jgi:hypothetical protein
METEMEMSRMQEVRKEWNYQENTAYKIATNEFISC